MTSMAVGLRVHVARGGSVGTLHGITLTGLATIEGNRDESGGSALSVVITRGRVAITLRGICVPGNRVDLLLAGSVGLERPESMDSLSVSDSRSSSLGASCCSGGESLEIDLVVTGTRAGRLQADAPQ